MKGRVIDLLIEQVKRFANLIIDTDVRAYRKEVKAQMRAKGKTLGGKKAADRGRRIAEGR